MMLSADIPKLYTALAEWLSCLAIILSHRGWRRNTSANADITIMVGILALLGGIQMICGLFSNAWWLVGMFAALCVMLLSLIAMLQIRQSQESMELINEKYHDLKHQLQVLKSHTGEDSLSYIDEMEREIRIYESEYHTGNSVLDTVLTSKGQLCLKHDIRLYVVADGALLGKIHVMDLAAIFGNALDNAIEHEMQIPEKEKRIIRVNVSSRNQMTCILIENYFQGILLQNGEDLVTTKTDKKYHGYGVKSIRHAVGKYGGVTTADAEGNWFRLRILLPAAD